MPKLPEGVAPRVPLNCLITASTRTTIYTLVGELEMSQGEVVDRAIQVLATSISFGPQSVNVKKISKKDRLIAERAASDLTARGADRDDIDYSDTESGPTTHILDAVGPKVSEGRGKASVADWRAGRKQLLKPSEKKRDSK